MKKFLLFIMMSVCAVTGAWAEIPTGATAIGSNGSYYKVDGKKVTVYIATEGDLSANHFSYGQDLPWKDETGITLKLELASTVSTATMGQKDDFYVLFQNKGYDLIDLSSFTDTQASDMLTAQNFKVSGQTKGILVPDKYKTTPNEFVRPGSAMNLYGIDGTTIYADIVSNTNTDLTSIISMVDGDVKSIHISGTATGQAAIDAINSLTTAEDVSITGKIHAGVNIKIENANITSLDFSGVQPSSGTLNIDLTKCTNLESVNFAGAKVEDVNLSGLQNLTDVNLTDANVSGTVDLTNAKTDNLKVHVSETKEGEKGITIVPQAVAENPSIVVGPKVFPYTFSECKMTLHEADESDPYVYWKTDGTIHDEKGIVSITVSDGETLASALTELFSEVGDDYAFCRVNITGAITDEDLEKLEALNTKALDLTGADISGVTDFSKVKNSNVRNLLLPSTATRETIVNATKLAGFTALNSAVARVKGETEDALQVYQQEDGTLQSSLVLYDDYLDGDPDPNNSYKGYYRSTAARVKQLTISGKVNAFDLGAGTGSLYLVKGHIEYETGGLEKDNDKAEKSRTMSSEAAEVEWPALKKASILSKVDLRDAIFDNINDLTLSEYNIVNVGNGGNSKTEIVIPLTVNTLPQDFLNVGSGGNLESICIPSNIEYIESRAFGGISVRHIYTTLNPNRKDKDGKAIEDETTKVDNGAFPSGATVAEGKQYEDYFVYGDDAKGKDLLWGTITFSSNLKCIKSHAFNGCYEIRDVYCLAVNAPECHVDAFTTKMLCGNNGFNSTLINEEGVVTRDAYWNKANGTYAWIAMLHFPKEISTPEVQRYTDPTREYSIATGMKDDRGNTIYFPNQSEWGRAYQQGTYGYVWRAWNTERLAGGLNAISYLAGVEAEGWSATSQTAANNAYLANKDNAYGPAKYCSFYDVTLGQDPATQPTDLAEYNTIYWDEKNLNTTGTGNQLYPLGQDYRGWHQFILTGYSANTTEDVVFERSYITDNDWWTVCLPYDLTYEEMITFFGDGSGNIPYLCKLLYVTRDVANGKITLNFSKNLMTHKEELANSTDLHGKLTNGICTISDTQPAATDVVLHKGVPYMIKPNIPADANRQFAFYLRSVPDKDEAELTDAEKAQKKENSLYEKLLEAETLSGDEQKNLIYNGIYTVPAILINNESNGEAAKSGANSTVTISGTEYPVSAEFNYSFVGTFYKSLLPQYCYFLGWDSKKQKAAFWYNRYNDPINWTWSNNTGIICPNYNTSKKITAATSVERPARWEIQAGTDLFNDDFTTKNEARRMPIMFFGAEGASENNLATGITEIKVEHTSLDNNVYSLNGQLVGHSTQGLKKGVYIVNGKKMVIK